MKTPMMSELWLKIMRNSFHIHILLTFSPMKRICSLDSSRAFPKVLKIDGRVVWIWLLLHLFVLNSEGSYFGH